ncbi:MAG: hypothetical protein V4568_09785 [Pseudomonadota bacterium]
MKPLIAFLFALFTTAVMAAEPSYTCNPERGCQEEQGPTYDIGRGAMLSLPVGWRFFSYPTAPDPIMTGLREIRAIKNGMVIAITPFPNIDKRVFSESQLCDLVSKSSGQYAKQSKEQTITPVSMSHGDIVGCHVSFTAANDGDKPFAVLPNRRHASVTTFAISYKYIIFSVSVVSEQIPDDDYRAVVNSIQQIK